MMIDWLSLKLAVTEEFEGLVKEYQTTQDRILRIGGDGSLQWEVSAWDSIRSDSHQLAFQATGSYIRIQGSPARIIGDGDNVFSSGASAALDLMGCAERMIKFIVQHTGIDLPSSPCAVAEWQVTRVDVTENLFLGSLPAVRQALTILRDCEGGRYRVSQQAGDSVYWSHNSRLRSGKAYAKGAELAHKMLKAAKAKIPHKMREYSNIELELASGLLRLELKLAAQYWRERSSVIWHKYTPEMLRNEWLDYFGRMIGGAEIMKTEDIYDRLLKVVPVNKQGKPKEGQAKAAYALWLMIQAEGWQKARDFTRKSTWYDSLKHLHAAGLSDADISAGKVVQLRQKIIEAKPVTSWADLATVYRMAA